MAGERFRVTRLGMQVLGDTDTSNPELRVTRLGMQVLADTATSTPEVRVTRLGMQVLGDGPTNPSPVRFTRYTAEVLSKTPPQPPRISRYSLETLSKSPKPPFRMSRISLSVLIKRGASMTSADVSTAQSLLMHNWAKSVQMETSFLTSISSSPVGGEEDRVSLLDKPVRTLNVQWNPDLIDGFKDFVYDVMRQGFERLPVPLYQHAIKLTGTTSGDYIPCDPALHRFFPKGTIVLFNWKDGHATDEQYLTILRVDPGGIHTNETISPALDSQYGIVAPMLLSEISLGAKFQAITDQLADAPLRFDEVSGDEALVSAAYGLPDNFEVYDGLPILTVDADWSKAPTLGFSRQGKKYKQGRASVVTPLAPRPSMTQDFNLLLDTQQSAWDMIRFLESRRGRALAFWMVGHYGMWTATGKTTSSVSVTAGERIQNLQDFLGYIGMVMADGSTIIREVTSVVDSGDWVINVTPDLPTAFRWQLVEKITWAARARNTKDSYKEEWVRQGVCRISFSAMELLNERNIDTPDLSNSTILTQPTSHLLLITVDPTVTTV